MSKRKGSLQEIISKAIYHEDISLELTVVKNSIISNDLIEKCGRSTNSMIGQFTVIFHVKIAIYKTMI